MKKNSPVLKRVGAILLYFILIFGCLAGGLASNPWAAGETPKAEIKLSLSEGTELKAGDIFEAEIWLYGVEDVQSAKITFGGQNADLWDGKGNTTANEDPEKAIEWNNDLSFLEKELTCSNVPDLKSMMLTFKTEPLRTGEDGIKIGTVAFQMKVDGIPDITFGVRGTDGEKTDPCVLFENDSYAGIGKYNVKTEGNIEIATVYAGPQAPLPTGEKELSEDFDFSEVREDSLDNNTGKNGDTKGNTVAATVYAGLASAPQAKAEIRVLTAKEEAFEEDNLEAEIWLYNVEEVQSAKFSFWSTNASLWDREEEIANTLDAVEWNDDLSFLESEKKLAYNNVPALKIIELRFKTEEPFTADENGIKICTVAFHMNAAGVPDITFGAQGILGGNTDPCQLFDDEGNSKYNVKTEGNIETATVYTGTPSPIITVAEKMLEHLSFSGVEGFAFDKNTRQYTLFVPVEETSVTLSGVTSQEDVSLKVNEQPYAEGMEIPLSGAETVITLLLEKGDDSIDYTFVIKEAVTPLAAFWPSFRGNPENMGVTDAPTPVSNAQTMLKWSLKAGGGYTNNVGPVLVIGDYLYGGGADGLLKIDKENGEVVGRAALSGPLGWNTVSPAYEVVGEGANARGVVFLALSGGAIEAFAADTLEQLWCSDNIGGGQNQCPVLYDDGRVYSGYWSSEVSEANYICLDAKTGEEIWRYGHKGGFYWAGAVVVGDALIVGGDDGDDGPSSMEDRHTVKGAKLHSLNKRTGAVIDAQPIIGDQRSTIAYDKTSGKVYFTTKSGYLYSAKITETGMIEELKGRYYNNLESTSTPVVYQGRVYFGTGTLNSDNSCVIVADAETLEEIYQVPMHGYPQGSGLLSTAYEEEEGTVYLYFTYNYPPGGITLIKDKPGQTTPDYEELFEPPVGMTQYCLSSVICDKEGTLYYLNDSATFFALTKGVAFLKSLSLRGPEGEIEIVRNENSKKGFTSGYTEYLAIAPPGTKSVDIHFTAPEGTGVTINGVSAESPYSLALQDHKASAEIIVSKEGDERTYTLDVREASSDAGLGFLGSSKSSNAYNNLSSSEWVPLESPLTPGIREYSFKSQIVMSNSNTYLFAYPSNIYASVKVYPLDKEQLKLGSGYTGLNEDGTMQLANGRVAPVKKEITNEQGETETVAFWLYDIRFADTAKRADLKLAVTAEDGRTEQEYMVTLNRDNTKPQILSSKIQRTSKETAKATFTCDQEGTYRYTVLEKGAPTPQTGNPAFYQNPEAPCVNGENVIEISGLSGNQEQDVYFFMRNGFKDYSEMQKLSLPSYSPGSGSSGGGGGGKTAAPDTGTVNVTASGGTGAASASVTAKEMTAVITQALEAAEKKEDSAKSEAKINVKADSRVTSVETVIPKESFGEAVKKALDTLTVVTPVGDLSLNKKAISAVSDGASGRDVKITIGKGNAEAALQSVPEADRAAIKEAIGDRPVYQLGITSDGREITGLSGGRATVTIPYTLKDGEKAEDIVVYYLDSSGKLTEVGAQYDASAKTVTFTTDHFSWYVIGYTPTEPVSGGEKGVSFTDVKSTDWYGEAVNFLTREGIIKGRTETTFAPQDNITRAEFAQILYGMSQARTATVSAATAAPKTPPFTDVKNNAWYEAAVAWAYGAKVVSGYEEEDGTLTFRPDARISRQEIAVMILNYADRVEQKSLPAENPEINFADGADIGAYAQNAVSLMQKAGIISGMENSDGSFSFLSENNATRAEAAQMIYRYMQIR
ncbi:MAG: S-layer homology domain-containing protein [Dehalobacterium sp.]